MQRIVTSLWFDNNAEEAVSFYTSIFKNSSIQHVSRYGEAGPGKKGDVMVVTFQLEGQDFMAINGGPVFQFTPAISLFVNCENQQEIDYLWNKLGDGGEAMQCGWLTDKFGVTWQIVPRILAEMVQDKDATKANQVVEAMLKMVKIDIDGLKMAHEGLSKPTFSIQRTFDAPRDLVFKAWTEPERLERWWGPKGFAFVIGKLDLRPNGIFHYCMRSPDGAQMWGLFTYREISVPTKLVFVNSFADPSGNPVRNPFSPNWPLNMYTVVTFSEDEGRTTVTLDCCPIDATELEQEAFAEGSGSMQQGFAGTFDQLAAYLAGA